MQYYCNPINFSYKYQFNKQEDGSMIASREAADPSMVLFKGKYLLFPSMTCGFLYSDDLINWQLHPLKDMPVYDYAPDVRVVGEWLYFCASNHEKGVYYRTKDPFSDTYERMDGAFPFWDPNLFADEDGRIYFFWGSSTTKPLYGIELDADTMQPIGERAELVWGNEEEKGFERTGENHIPERSKEEKEFLLSNLDKAPIPENMKEAARAFILGSPYIEGVWVNKYQGKYYLQYGASGSRFNVYGDGVYVSDRPLGPYRLALNNPYSYKPGGFLPGAGHGSTMQDKEGKFWHTATMRICVNHNFERRIGLWPAGFDADGELYCDQRYGDWPRKITEKPFENPEWMLLSYGKKAKASSCAEGKGAQLVTNENVQNWWRAATNKSGEWVEVDLGREYEVHAVQINFADDHMVMKLPEEAQLHGALNQERWIDEVPQRTRWLLEGSLDGENYFTVEDKRQAETDLPHDLVVHEDGIQTRYLRLSVTELPYQQAACVSALRIFGILDGAKPDAATNVKCVMKSDLDMEVSWNGNATGYCVIWGYAPDKLYHSYQVFDKQVCIGGLVKGQPVYVRVDSFNDSGITEGVTIKVK